MSKLRKLTTTGFTSVQGIGELGMEQIPKEVFKPDASQKGDLDRIRSLRQAQEKDTKRTRQRRSKALYTSVSEAYRAERSGSSQANGAGNTGGATAGSCSPKTPYWSDDYVR